MILAITFRGTKRRPRSHLPDALGFATKRHGRHLNVPALAVTRLSRAKAVTGILRHEDGRTEKIRITWPSLKPGMHKEINLETI